MRRHEVSWDSLPQVSTFLLDGRRSCSLLKLTSILTDEVIAGSASNDVDQQVREQREVGMYLIEQILLFANMASGRSYNCIAK
jgi:hypothetical protein